jgi:hypothetical protein
MGCGSVVVIAAGYVLDDFGFEVKSSGGVKNIHFSMFSRLALGLTHHPIQWVKGTGT